MKRISISLSAALKTFRGFATAGNLESKIAAVVKEPNLNEVVQGLCSREGWRTGEVKDREKAEEVLEEMNRKGFRPDEPTYTSLIVFFSKWVQVDKARKLLNEMIVAGFSPSLDAYNALVDAYSTRTRLDEAVGILRGMAQRGLSPDAHTYGPVINSYCASHSLHKYMNRAWASPMNKDLADLADKALQLMKEMVHKGILPHADTYSSLIKCLCRQPRPLEAFHLFREMLMLRGEPDSDSYFDLKDALCHQGEFSKVFHLHDEMVHKGFLPHYVTHFSPSLVTYNALIYGYCFLERAEEALGILRGMPEMGLSPDVVSYNTLISGFCRIREPGKAYQLMLEMPFEKRFSWPSGFRETYLLLMKALSDEDAYSSLMNEYLAQGNLDQAEKLHDEMRRRGHLSCNVRYKVFWDGLNKKARTREAKEILLGSISLIMIDSSSYPTYLVYDTLIENCSNNEFKSLAEQVKSFSKRGLVSEAARVHDTMLEGNYKLDGAVYNLLIFDHCRCRAPNVHKAFNMYMEMMHYGFAPHMFSVLALIYALYCGGRRDEVSWIIHNTLRSCNLDQSELLKVLNDIDVTKHEIEFFRDVLAEIAIDGLLLDGGKCSYASAGTY